jgi:hypothetical protein
MRYVVLPLPCPTQKAWADKYFPDITQIQVRYLELIKTINYTKLLKMVLFEEI